MAKGRFAVLLELENWSLPLVECVQAAIELVAIRWQINYDACMASVCSLSMSTVHFQQALLPDPSENRVAAALRQRLAMRIQTVEALSAIRRQVQADLMRCSPGCSIAHFRVNSETSTGLIQMVRCAAG